MLDALIKDVRNLIPKEYEFRIEASSIGLDIIFGEECFEPDALIVTYGWEEFAYFNLERMKIKDFNYGYDKVEINTVSKLIDYLEEHKEYLNELMEVFKVK